MRYTKVNGLEEDIKAQNQEHYSWWSQHEENEARGFQFSVFFPNGILPAVTVQLWSHRLDFGWFF